MTFRFCELVTDQEARTLIQGLAEALAPTLEQGGTAPDISALSYRALEAAVKGGRYDTLVADTETRAYAR